MILILSDHDDHSTTDVINWLIYRNIEYIRINGCDTIEIIDINIEKQQTIIRLTNYFEEVSLINLFEITGYWYRRGGFNLINYTNIPEGFYTNIKIFYNVEKNYLMNFLHDIIHLNPNVKIIGDIKFNNINKLSMLLIARKCGLEIPNSIVSSNKISVKNEFKDNRIITKTLNVPLNIDENEKVSNVLFTSEIKLENIIDEDFELTLFQELLEKKYELRIFYLNNTLYSSCIFSQNDAQTSVDFRNYNHKKPNRVIPFLVPKDIESKIINFMNEIKLNSGSIDIVVTKEDKFVFLEVNPIGQFAQVSHPCNYNLENKIATELIN